MQKQPEILAPAGSRESLVAAAVCGADAVYLGGKTLNARRNADNMRRYDCCLLHWSGLRWRTCFRHVAITTQLSWH